MPQFTPIKHTREIPQFAPESSGWKNAQKFDSRGRVIDGYTLIEKKECPYFLPYRIARFVVGALATVCSVGCLYYHSTTIRKLVTKSSETIRFGIATPTKKKPHSSKKLKGTKKPKRSLTPSVSSKSRKSASISAHTPRSSTPDTNSSFSSFASQEQDSLDKERSKSHEPQVVVQTPWQRALALPEDIEASRLALERGIVLSDATAEKIRSSMERIISKRDGDGFEFYTSQDQHRVFTLESEPDVIFKLGLAPGRMRQRLQNIAYVNAVRTFNQLNMLVIPRVKLVNIGTERQPQDLLIEERLNINPYESALAELYLTESRRLDKAVAELGHLIQYTGISDVEARNCPPIISQDPTQSHKIALIDLQTLKHPKDGLYGGKYSGRGLYRTISTKYAPEFAKISAVITRNHSDKSFKRVRSERKLELAERDRLLQYYTSKGIQSGGEPLPVTPQDLDFSEQYIPEQAEKIHALAIHLIRAMNRKMVDSSQDEAVMGRRKIRIHTTQGRFKEMDRTFIDETRFPKGTTVTEENYRFTYLGCVIDKLLDLGAIYQLVARDERGYLIQA